MELSVSALTDKLSEYNSISSLAPKKQESFIGVDIGSSSIKIVQLRVVDNIVTLETYGEISNAPYANAELGTAGYPAAGRGGAELLDLMHEVNAISHGCGVAVPLSETLIHVVDLPKRDPEQMRRIIPTEAKKYIPVALDTVMLDWYPLPESESSAFDTVKANTQVAAQFQKVMLVAVTNDTTHRLAETVKGTNLACEFYEIEMFSVVRACAREGAGPALILDLGATTTKAYILNENWQTLATRAVPLGGVQLTQELAKALSCDFSEAERMKCEQGLSGQSLAPLTASLAPLWIHLEQLLSEYNKNGKPLARVMLCGAGAYLPGLVQLTGEKLSLPVELVQAFDKTKGPMILEDALKQDGPRFAVAVGLALRGIGR